MKNLITELYKKINKKSEEFEFRKINNIIKSEFKEDVFSLLDVGSGFCGFANYIRVNFSNANISCVDINKDLVKLAEQQGFKAIIGKITNLPYADNSFDIIHCSHVIEHLGYPDIIIALNELIRVTKTEGLIIIRSPLWANHRFYNDIDHVRPYPPDSILNYFTNLQQQQVGKDEVCEIDRWYTRIYYEINPYKFTLKIISYINIALKLCWLTFSFPCDRPNNYGIVLKKKN
ncbi:MAG TPA: class I SAM-dependent methyltransferase [Bacilli bacterium]|nr:class I SAM-dependent methyltransferase [Bacilli bacterium]